jgi:bifunctional non-homologous end joining protein LigD
MALETYRAKRDFRRTPEPRGLKGSAKSHALRFVIQKHAASHLHYDFRLELNGVLLSWAVPKGPSLDPSDKRLAMHVEDHPLDYGGFEGVIPQGEYGGGTVMVWDQGTWTPLGDAAAGYAKGHFKFILHGEKLRGAWALVQTHGSKYGGKSGKQAWLLIKEKDAEAKPGGKPIVDTAPDSVLTGRSMEDIRIDKTRVWRSKLSPETNVRNGAVATLEPASPRTAGLAKSPAMGATKAPLPTYVSPVLATLNGKAPPGDDWISEVKYDGYRMVCRIERGRAKLFSRNRKEWTEAFAGVAEDLGTLPVKTAWLDGEVVVLDADGRSSFQALQNALTQASTTPLTFFAFDLMYLDGYDLRDVVLQERKRLLRQVVGKGTAMTKMGPEVRGGGVNFFQQACTLGLEGAIFKRLDSLYTPGVRSPSWLKVKCISRQEMVVGGYTDPQGSRSGFGALLLGHYDGAMLRYAGKVGTGFDDEMLKTLTPQLKSREQKLPPFVNPPTGYAAKGAHWIRPELVAEIAFTEWSKDGALRHPSFQGLRADKKARDVVREFPAEAGVAPQPGIAKGAARTPKPDVAKSAVKPSKARAAGTADKAPEPKVARSAAKTSKRVLPLKGAPDVVAGIPLSNSTKLYFPEARISKGDLARYYANIAPHLLPHLAGRPLSLVRCPDGWTGKTFYQKHADASVSPAVARIEVPEGKGAATYMGASTAEALVALVQWGVIEMHPWGSREPRLDRPDRLVFDFDPDEKLSWAELVDGVRVFRTLLDELKLKGFLKTTGGKGLHVVLPIAKTLSWASAKSFTKSVADFLVTTFPDRFTATMSKEQRKGRIFIDYLRNTEGATAVAAFVVRARANAPVSTPIAWEELSRDVRFDYFNVSNVPARLKTLKADPWSDFFSTRQTITVKLLARFG